MTPDRARTPTPTGSSGVPGRTFVDTNVFVSAVDKAEPRKRECALAAARQAPCDMVLTEDLPDGVDYDGIRISSPFT